MPPPTTLPCKICASPTASSLHFGARSCKACAAFFRRTVSMQMTYACSASPSTRPCNIHYHLRMICRHCRYLKCVEAGMKRELVQRKPETEDAIKRESTDSRTPPVIDLSATYIEECLPPPVKKPKEEILEIEMSPEPSTSSTASTSHDASPATRTAPPNDPPGPVQPSPSGCSHRCFDIRVGTPAEVAEVISHYINRERIHADRKRLLHTNVTVQQLFDGDVECAYDRESLRPFNFPDFKGMDKQDLLACYDHTLNLQGVHHLKSMADKNLLYRYVVLVDYVLGAAYISARVGKEEGLFVLANGTFINMRPMPPTGEEAIDKFADRKELELYQFFMPMFIRHYEEVVLPLIQLDLHWKEYVILKAITTWQMAHFRVSAECRLLCESQRNLLVAALHQVAGDLGHENPGVRVGNVLLYLANVLEFTTAVISMFFKITVFDLHEIDPLIKTMCSFVF